jgi:excisionase family DNA binding protein
LERLLTTEELAEYLNLPIGTLYRFNYIGSGPRPIKVGRHLRYRESDIDRWLDSRTPCTEGFLAVQARPSPES